MILMTMIMMLMLMLIMMTTIAIVVMVMMMMMMMMMTVIMTNEKRKNDINNATLSITSIIMILKWLHSSKSVFNNLKVWRSIHCGHSFTSLLFIFSLLIIFPSFTTYYLIFIPSLFLDFQSPVMKISNIKWNHPFFIRPEDGQERIQVQGKVVRSHLEVSQVMIMIMIMIMIIILMRIMMIIE